MEEKREIREELLKLSRAFARRIEQYKQARKVPGEIERNLLRRKDPCNVFLNLHHNGTILFITPPLPGYTFEDTSGITVYSFINFKQQAKSRKATEELLKSGEVVSYETNSFGAAGSMIMYTTFLSPDKNSNKVIRAVQRLTNITTCNKAKKLGN